MFHCSHSQVKIQVRPSSSVFDYYSKADQFLIIAEAYSVLSLRQQVVSSV
jgi:hypothetical protein